MPKKKAVSLDTLLKHPEVQQATSNINSELIERRAFIPPACGAFLSKYTKLAETSEYRFEIDRDARKQLPGIINNKVQMVKACNTADNSFIETYRRKRKVGVVFSGGPAPGGHNVIAGLFDALKKANPDSVLYGFLLGPDGIIENETVELTREMVDQYRNIGGFTMIRTGRTKIDSREKMTLSRQTCKSLGLDALVVVGGDDSNTNAAFLAQEMMADGIQVIGVPKTIDGDIQVRDARGEVLCSMSFGFHSAARGFAQNISSLCTDASSDVKYWHICKVMGRVASHLALEVALQTHANITLIGEDLADYVDTRRIAAAKQAGTIDYTAYGMTLRHLSRVICDSIVKRSAVGKNYGVLVIPEGVLEFINEIQMYIIKLSTIIGDYNATHDSSFHKTFVLLEDKLEYLRRLKQQAGENGGLPIWNARDNDLFNDIPEFFQEGLLTERDNHGNFQFSLVQTDKILLGLVNDYLEILKEKGLYKVGIEEKYFEKMLSAEGLDPEQIGSVIFQNFGQAPYLLMRKSIFSIKTLKQTLLKSGLIQTGADVPAPIMKIYKKSMPNFKTQRHFYGYDGRGSHPTRFDCNYTYNLGLTVFSLIANGATGQMAAIKNLEKKFSRWEPVGIPIAPLMHLEERKGKLELVLEKSVVELDSVAFRVVKAFRDKWLAAVPGEDNYRRPGPIRFTGNSEEDRPLTLVLNALADE